MKVLDESSKHALMTRSRQDQTVKQMTTRLEEVSTHLNELTLETAKKDQLLEHILYRFHVKRVFFSQRYMLIDCFSDVLGGCF